jgi:hypothetical protein
MRELASVIPDSNVLLAIEPEELGGKILFLLRNASKAHRIVRILVVKSPSRALVEEPFAGTDHGIYSRKAR